VAIISVLLNMFYAKLLVPLFNKQAPLEDGNLRSKIEKYASRMNFNLENVFVIDGSKRSKKANAYFSGFGKEKRVTLFDTLINDLNDEEIVAVLAHEVGHYKKKHIIVNLFISIVNVGFTLWLLSLFVSEPLLAQALGVNETSFHVGLVAFSFLYAPISLITGIFTNILSRKFEYQADNFAKSTFSGEYLSSALKKLSKNSLSNLTPHPAYVYFHFSHPPLIERLRNLKNNL
jgi:STE24 endopeptidase